MGTNPDAVREQLVELFDSVDFPVSSRAEIERQLNPSDAYKRIESGDFSMTLASIDNAVSGAGEFPYESAEAIADELVTALGEQDRL